MPPAAPRETPEQRRARWWRCGLAGVPGIAAIRLELAWRRVVEQRGLALVDEVRAGTRVLATGTDGALGPYTVALKPEDGGAWSAGVEVTPRDAAELAFVLESHLAFHAEPSWPQGAVRNELPWAELRGRFTLYTNDPHALAEALPVAARTALVANPQWTLYRDRGARLGVGWAGRVRTTAQKEARELDAALSLLRMLVVR